MNWYSLWCKLGKQQLSKLQKAKVYVELNGINLPLALKYNAKGNPFFVIKNDYKPSEKEILIKAYKVMIDNYNKDLDFCEGITKCDECPFKGWQICPNEVMRLEDL